MKILSMLLLVVCALFDCYRADWLHDLQNGQTLTVGDNVQLRVDRINDSNENKTSYFRTHVLKVFLGEVGLTIGKAHEKDGLQIGLFTTGNGNGNSTKAQGRGNDDAHVFHVVLPLLIGFKIAGSIIATLLAVVVVSLKAFLASKVALLLSGTIALKKLMGHDPPPEIHYPVEFAPSHYSMDEYHPTATGYHAPPDHEHSHEPDHSAPSSYEPTGHETADSKISAQYVPSRNGTTYHPPGGKRRILRRKNAIAPSLLAVHKITRH